MLALAIFFPSTPSVLLSSQRHEVPLVEHQGAAHPWTLAHGTKLVRLVRCLLMEEVELFLGLVQTQALYFVDLVSSQHDLVALVRPPPFLSLYLHISAC
jgi:hypothetical protein